MASDQDDSQDGDDAAVLSPEELDITDDESVAEIDEGRYVISPNESAPKPIKQFEKDDDPIENIRSGEGLTAEEVTDWLQAELENSGSQYGFNISAKFKSGIEHERLYSNDIVTTFENLLVWYAQRAGGDTPVEEVLGILLLESSVPITFPPRTIREFVSDYDLKRSDTIGDLLDGIKDDDVQFPP